VDGSNCHELSAFLAFVLQDTPRSQTQAASFNQARIAFRNAACNVMLCFFARPSSFFQIARGNRTERGSVSATSKKMEIRQ